MSKRKFYEGHYSIKHVKGLPVKRGNENILYFLDDGDGNITIHYFDGNICSYRELLLSNIVLKETNKKLDVLIDLIKGGVGTGGTVNVTVDNSDLLEELKKMNLKLHADCDDAINTKVCIKEPEMKVLEGCLTVDVYRYFKGNKVPTITFPDGETYTAFYRDFDWGKYSIDDSANIFDFEGSIDDLPSILENKYTDFKDMVLQYNSSENIIVLRYTKPIDLDKLPVFKKEGIKYIAESYEGLMDPDLDFNINSYTSFDNYNVRCKEIIRYDVAGIPQKPKLIDFEYISWDGSKYRQGNKSYTKINDFFVTDQILDENNFDREGFCSLAY